MRVSARSGCISSRPLRSAPLIAQLRATAHARQALLIRSNAELRALSLRIFERTFVITRVLYWLAAGVAAVGLVSALLAWQLERARQLALLRSLGLTPAGSAALILAQTLFMGFAALGAAIPAGLHDGAGAHRCHQPPRLRLADRPAPARGAVHRRRLAGARSRRCSQACIRRGAARVRRSRAGCGRSDARCTHGVAARGGGARDRRRHGCRTGAAPGGLCARPGAVRTGRDAAQLRLPARSRAAPSRSGRSGGTSPATSTAPAGSGWDLS